jgi:ABC-type sulfate transport system substrate-binding protein
MSILKRTLLAVATVAALTSSISFAGKADFTLVNRTGYDIREVYLSASNRNSWGNDRMGEFVLEKGKSRLFKFNASAACKQDLKVVFDDDESEVEWTDFDLCETNKITLKYNRRTKEVSADSE